MAFIAEVEKAKGYVRGLGNEKATKIYIGL